MRVRFLGDVIEVFERVCGARAVEEAERTLEERFKLSAGFMRFRSQSSGEVVDLSSAEVLLLGLDAALGAGDGAMIELAGRDIFARRMSDGNLVVPGDLLATVSHLRAPLTYPFVELELGWDLASSSSGFTLYIVAPRHPRTARILQYIGTGALKSAQRFVTAGRNLTLDVVGSTIADRVTLDARHAKQASRSATVPITGAPDGITGRFARAGLRVPSSSTLREVEAILSRIHLS